MTLPTNGTGAVWNGGQGEAVSYELALRERYAEVRRRLGAPRASPLQMSPTSVSDRPYVIYAPINLISRPSWKILLRIASLKTGISEQRIMGRDRDVMTVHARFMTMALMRKHLNESLPVISGRWGMDHSTALHAIRKYESGQSSMRAAEFAARPRWRSSSRPKREVACTRWTKDEKAEAQAMRDDGMLLEGIADWFGVSRNAVQAMLKRHERELRGKAGG